MTAARRTRDVKPGTDTVSKPLIFPRFPNERDTGSAMEKEAFAAGYPSDLKRSVALDSDWRYFKDQIHDGPKINL